MEAEKKQKQLSVEARIGQNLRQARLEKSMSLKDVAQILKIRQVYVQALEKGNFSEIKPEVYLLGFLRTYARFLGLDEKEFCSKYHEQEIKKELKQEEALKVEKQKKIEQDSKSWFQKVVLRGFRLSSIYKITPLLLIAFIIAIGYVAWFEGEQDDIVESNTLNTQSATNSLVENSQEEVKENPQQKVISEEKIPYEGDSLDNLSKEKEGTLPNNTKEISSIPLNKPYLKASEEAWVAFNDASNNRILSKNMEEGDILIVPEGAEFLIIGNAGGAQLYKADQDINLGRRGEVRRHSIKKLFAQFETNS